MQVQNKEKKKRIELKKEETEAQNSKKKVFVVKMLKKFTNIFFLNV